MFVGMLKREDKISLGKFDLYFNLPSTSIVHARMLRYFAISSLIQQNYFVRIRVENKRKSHERDEVDDIKMLQLNSIEILRIFLRVILLFYWVHGGENRYFSMKISTFFRSFQIFFKNLYKFFKSPQKSSF